MHAFNFRHLATRQKLNVQNKSYGKIARSTVIGFLFTLTTAVVQYSEQANLIDYVIVDN